jgi:hypothetical protein
VTVAVSCNLSDGVVLAVDSAVTVPDPAGGVAKIYEHAQKLFQIGERPVGTAVFGLGTLGNRTIGSYIREFEQQYSNELATAGTMDGIRDVVETLRAFFLDRYMAQIAPALEEHHKTKFDELAPDQIPVLGLVVGGFSRGAFLSEVWNIALPVHKEPGSAILSRQQGDFGTNWFAMFEPIQRYIKGYDGKLMDAVIHHFLAKRAGEDGVVPDLDPDELAEIFEVLNPFEYNIPFPAMPMPEGIAHTRFLAELVVSHHRYATGAPIVGGDVVVGSVTYREGTFQIHPRNGRMRT